MSTCTYGASVASGLDPDGMIMVDRSLWETVTGSPTSWLDSILELFIPSFIKRSDLCALNLDDPGDPNLDDLVDAQNGDPFAMARVLDWTRRKLEYVAFQSNCVCNGSLGSACAAPADLCYSIGSGLQMSLGSTIAAPSTNPHNIPATAGDTIVVSWTGVSRNGGSFPCNGNLYWYDDVALTWTFIRTIWFDAGGPGSWSFTAPRTANFELDIWTESNVGAFCVTGLKVECPGCAGSSTPPAVTEPTQPTTYIIPDPYTCGTSDDICKRLYQIQEMLRWNYQMTTLLQRQIIPFALQNGASVTGRTDSGNITVQGILGVSVTLTSVPSGWGSTAETPRRLIPAAGSIQATDGTRYSDNFQLHYEHQVVMLDAPWATSVKYNLRPGVVATIQTLLREP